MKNSCMQGLYFLFNNLQRGIDFLGIGSSIR